MRQSDREFLGTEMRALDEAGIPVKLIRSGRRPMFRIATETNAEAQIVWSYLEAEECFIERSPSYPRENRTTWYPTGYICRLLHDWDRRMIVGIGLSLFLFPVMMVFAFSIMRALRPPSITEAGLMTFLLWALAVWVLIELLFVVWMFNNKEFGMERLLARFVVGVAFGVMWVFILGEAVTPALLIGAVWTFSGANLVWGVTAGMDHWRLDYEFGRVGGRLPRDVALKRLDERRDARHSIADAGRSA